MPIETSIANKTLLPLLALSLIVLVCLPAFGDSRDRDKSTVITLRDCPQIEVMGSRNLRMVSLSDRGFLGVETSNLTPELRQHFGVEGDAGLMISRVLEDSAAAEAGLEVGDIVTQVDGEKITSTSRLGSVIRRSEGGDVVDIEFWRDGNREMTQATLEERERCAFDIGSTLEGLDLDNIPQLGAMGFQISGDALEISGEAIESAMETVREVLESQDWERHFEDLKDLDLDQIELHLDSVQERLERLEDRLEREYGQEREDDERQHDRESQDRESPDDRTL